jgi:hypothetical protein
MAIDSRIALAGTPLNIGKRFGRNVQNLRNVDLLSQQRDLVPLQLEQAQRANELGIAQQPALLQTAGFAASPESQLANQQQQAQQIATTYATALRPLLNNPQALVSELQRQKAQFQQAGVPTAGIDEDILQAQTPEGLALLADEVNDTLTPISSRTASAGQREFESKLVGLDDEQKNEATLIALGLKPRATGSAAQTIAATGTTGAVAGSEAAIAGAKEAATQAAGNIGKAVGKGLDAGVKAFEKIPSVRTAIVNYDDAIAQLDAGAETGIIDSMLPSFTVAGKNLDNTIKRLGLDVVGNTTFGALSGSELAFALKAAIPDNLQPAELRKWLVAKRNAQQKLLTGLDEMANFLGDGTKTLVDWNNRQAVNALAPSTLPQIPGGNVDLSKLSIEELKAMKGGR